MTGADRGLPHYIRQKGEAMRRAAERRPAAADWRETVEATCVADDATGVRKLTTEGFTIIGDSGPDFGGWGLGPTSPSLFCGVISTCLTHTYLIAAAWLNIPIERVAVRVTAGNNDAHLLDIDQDDPAVPFDITAHVTLDAPEATPAQIADLHAYAAERCPLSNLVRTPNEVTIVIE